MLLPCCKRERYGLSATDAYKAFVSDGIDIGGPPRVTRPAALPKRPDKGNNQNRAAVYCRGYLGLHQSTD